MRFDGFIPVRYVFRTFTFPPFCASSPMTSSVGHGGQSSSWQIKSTTARAVLLLLCKGYKKDIFGALLTGFESNEIMKSCFAR
jgi:hypothetical protein